MRCLGRCRAPLTGFIPRIAERGDNILGCQLRLPDVGGASELASEPNSDSLNPSSATC